MKCKHMNEKGICMIHSDNEVIEPCIKGPCKDEKFIELSIDAAFDIGEKVYFKCYRGKEPEYIQGEIIRISVTKNKEGYNIRYSHKRHA